MIKETEACIVFLTVFLLNRDDEGGKLLGSNAAEGKLLRHTTETTGTNL